jgi:hypothetical protein
MTGIPTETLKAVAKQAAGEFLAEGTDLSSAVVKAASLLHEKLTDEHVRRICEMTYREAFERTFRDKAGSADRYVSFDPPDPAFCAQQLKAAALHVPPPSPFDIPSKKKEASMDILKAASAPLQRYVPTNHALRALYVEKRADNWLDPYAEVREVRNALKEAVKVADSERNQSDVMQSVAFAQLCGHAEQACKEGADVGMVLHVCTAGLDAGAHRHEVSGALSEVADHLLSCGYTSGGKLASNYTPNPNHPLASLFYKVASLRTKRAEYTAALKDLRLDLNDVETRLRSLHA